MIATSETRPPKAALSVSHAEDAVYESGLRPAFEYRDLGVAEATGGRAMALLMRAKPGEPGAIGWHRHDLDFQIFYVLRGWITFDYEGVGPVTARAGTCVHQPPGIRHAEVAHSDDLELLEVTLPGRFETIDVAKPT